MKSEVINIKTPVSRVGNKTAILHILYALFPLHYGRFIDVFGGSGSVLLGKPTIDAFEVYNDFDRNLVNLFRCMKERTMATIRELGFCNLNSREDFIAIRKFFDHETFDDRFLTEELMLTEIMLPPPEAAELKEIRKRITEDYDVRRAAMFLKLLRNSYSSSGKSFASQPFDIRKLFGLIQELEDRMANVVIENQDFETLIRHYDRPDAFFYADPPYFSTEDMYEVGFGWDDEASTDGKKETTIGGEITIEDIVSYHNLTPGKEYVVKGTLMNKTTGKPVTVNDEPVTAETAFTPEARDGEVKVTFTFNSYVITETTDVVVFESLYREEIEIAVHADIEDEGQSVKVYVPEIKTTASINGKKEITTAGKVTIEDVVSYTNLIPGTEYTIRGTLMNKATGEVFTVNGETITAEVKFTPESRNGEVKVTFTFDAHDFTTSTKLVVFESLYREDVEITTHKDIEDKDQTVTITPPPDVPQTGDNSNLGVWIGLGGIALGGAIACVIMYFKKKDDGEK